MPLDAPVIKAICCIMFSPSSTLVADEIYFLGIMREDSTFGNITDAMPAVWRIICRPSPLLLHTLSLGDQFG